MVQYARGGLQIMEDDEGFYSSGGANTDYINATQVNMISHAQRGNKVISGCEVTAQSTPDYTVQISSGTVAIDGLVYTISSIASLDLSSHIPATSGESRYVILTADGDMASSADFNTTDETIKLGAPATTGNQIMPNLTLDEGGFNDDSHVPLAVILLTNGMASIGNNSIADARSFVSSGEYIDGAFRVVSGSIIAFDTEPTTGHIGIGNSSRTDVGVFIDSPAQNVNTNQSYDRFRVDDQGALTIQNGTTSPWVTTAHFEEPNIVLTGSGVVTDAATVYIGSAPTEATNNYALYIGSGDSYFGGDADFNNFDINNVSEFQWNLTPSVAGHTEGRMYWSDDTKTITVDLDATDVSLEIGQELHFRGRNVTGSLLSKGSVVFISGASGQRPTIALADADTGSVTSDFSVGVTTHDIADNQNGYVTTFGFVRDVDTSAWSAGDVLYLSTTPGELTNTVPTPPNAVIRVGFVVTSDSSGIIHVDVDVYPDLGELRDVNEASLSDGDLLIRDEANGYWYNSNILPTEMIFDVDAKTVSANQDYHRIKIDNTNALTIQDTTTSALVTSAYFDEPNISLTGSGAVTDASTIYIAGAPTEGDNNYALYVNSGVSYFGDNLDLGGNSITSDGNGVDIAENLHLASNGFIYLGGTDIFLQDNVGNLKLSANGATQIFGDADDSGSTALQFFGGSTEYLRLTGARAWEMYANMSLEDNTLSNATGTFNTTNFDSNTQNPVAAGQDTTPTYINSSGGLTTSTAYITTLSEGGAISSLIVRANIDNITYTTSTGGGGGGDYDIEWGYNIGGGLVVVDTITVASGSSGTITWNTSNVEVKGYNTDGSVRIFIRITGSETDSDTIDLGDITAYFNTAFGV